MRPTSTPITVFQEKTIPDGTRLAGWAALAHGLGIQAPVRRPSCVSESMFAAAIAGKNLDRL